jgi:hypothetical protein
MSSVQPAQVGGVPTALPALYGPNSNILSTTFVANANGNLVTIVAISSGSPAAIVQVVRNGIPFALNSGNTLTAGAEYPFTNYVQAGETVNYSFASGTTLGLFRSFFYD